MIDTTGAAVFAIPTTTQFRGIAVREGMLIAGPVGWGEFSPFPEYPDHEAASWLAAALEACLDGWPAPVRSRIPVNCTVPAVEPARAQAIAAASGCRTAKIKVAERPGTLAEDLARVAAVRDALGPSGAVRIDANGAWDVDTAVAQIKRLDAAAGGLEYVEQPCAGLDELAAVRRRVQVRIAADESIRRAADPLKVALAGAADVVVLKVSPLGGVRRALRVAESAGLPCVVSSALETSVGLAAGLALAGALPELEFACGLGTGSLLAADVVSGPPLEPVDGWLPVPTHPPVPDPGRLDALRAEAARTEWWRERLGRILSLTAGSKIAP